MPKTKTTTLDRTWLIQRLEAPPEAKDKDFALKCDQTFGFGGGGGQINDDWWKVLYEIWRFEYMGAAEFEYGAVPKALEAMLNEPCLVSWRIEVKGKQVHIIGSALEREEIEARIQMLALDGMRLKEQSLFCQALEPEKQRYQPRTKGWLELNNGFFFTIDQQMHDRLWELLQKVKELKAKQPAANG